jgi:hypothetical protein
MEINMEKKIAFNLGRHYHLMMLTLATIMTVCLVILTVKAFEKPIGPQSVRICDFTSCANVNFGSLQISGEVDARIED